MNALKNAKSLSNLYAKTSECGGCPIYEKTYAERLKVCKHCEVQKKVIKEGKDIWEKNAKSERLLAKGIDMTMQEMLLVLESDVPISVVAAALEMTSKEVKELLKQLHRVKPEWFIK